MPNYYDFSSCWIIVVLPHYAKKSIVIFGYMWTQTKLTQQFYTVLNVLRFISCQVVNGQDQSFAMNPLGPLNTLRRTQNVVYSATLKVLSFVSKVA